MNVSHLVRVISGAAVAAFMLGAGSSVAAQVRVIDQGVFDISVSGAPAGVEEFSIRGSGSEANPQIVATAEITIAQPGGDMHLRPALQLVGREMRVTAYQQKISGTRVEDIFLTAENDRFYTRSRTEAGEREREFRAPTGTLVLESQVAHHYHFLANSPVLRGSVVSLVVPMEGRQASLTLSDLGGETIEIAGSSVSATRLLLGEEGTGISLWVDAEGRVLRVDNPSVGYSAVRRELPEPPQ